MAETFSRIEKGIYKRGDYSFQVKMMVGGLSLSETFDTLEEARAYRDSKRVSKALDPDFKKVVAARIKKHEAASLTLLSALERYEKEVTPHKKGAEVEKTRIGKLKRYSIARLSLYTIGPDEVLDFLEELEDEGLSENSRRKYASLVSHLFTIALKRWRYAVTNPIPMIELPSNGKPRKRRLEDGEEEKLFSALAQESPYVLALVRVAIETASRRGELLKLTWQDVKIEADGTGSAILHDPKNGETRIIPLSEDAIAALRTLPTPLKKTGAVFPTTARQVRAAWGRAREAAGCPDLRFHDLRHEGVLRLFELGLNSLEAASVSGHKTLQMLKDYTHLRANKLAKKINEAKAEDLTRKMG